MTTPALLLLPFLCLARAAVAVPEDPYAAMGRKISFAAREAGLSSIAVVPFQTLEGGGDVGGRLVAERVAQNLSRGGGLTVLDGRLLTTGMGGNRRSPDGPVPSEDDQKLYEEVLKQFALLDLGLPGTFDHADNRKAARGLIQDRLVELKTWLHRREMRKREEPPEAEAVLTGVLIPLLDGRVEVHARLASSDISAVVTTVSAKVERDWGVRARSEPPPPRDYGGLAGLAGAGAMAMWFLVKIGSG